MNPTVSIIIPSFNCGPYICDALCSIKDQEIADHEVIVVDDCSTDNTGEVVNKCLANVTYLRNSVNSGVSSARNRALGHARGKYIAFLDADDAWLPGKLKAQIEVLEQNPSVVAVGGEMIPFDQKTPELPPISPPLKLFGFSDMVAKNHLATPTVMARRDAVAALGGFCEKLTICEDYDLWLRLAQLGKIAKLCAPLARFRARPDGLSAGNAARTHALHCEFVRSLPLRYMEAPGIRQLVRIHLAQIALERSIDQVDIRGQYLAGCAALAESWRQWPFRLPTCKTPFVRLRRFAHTVRKGAATLLPRHV